MDTAGYRSDARAYGSVSRDQPTGFRWWIHRRDRTGTERKHKYYLRGSDKRQDTMESAERARKCDVDRSCAYSNQCFSPLVVVAGVEPESFCELGSDNRTAYRTDIAHFGAGYKFCCDSRIIPV